MKSKAPSFRVGLGFDSHAFSGRGRLAFGGLRVAGVPALRGHSDGDALLHAVIDAVLGACGLGDIGELFPDTSRKWKGADSRRLLRLALARARAVGYRPVQMDATVVGHRPRLAPIKAKLRGSLARLLGVPAADVNIKGKTPEGLAWFGPDDGVAVWVVATVERIR